MNVEKLQKMNELAKELKEHGLVESMDEAYTRADGIINTTGLLEIRNLMTNKEIPATAIDLERSNKQFNDLTEKLTLQNSKIDQMSSTMMKMQEVMNEMISEIVKLKETPKQQPAQNAVMQQRPQAPPEDVLLAERQLQAIQKQQIFGGMPQQSAQSVQSVPERSYSQEVSTPQLREVPREAPVQQANAAPGEARRGMYAEKQDTAHPRQGNFTPMDVSIEKFFHTRNMK